MNPLQGLYTFPRGMDMAPYKENFEVYNEKRNMNVQNWYTTITDFEQNPYWLVNRTENEDKRAVCWRWLPLVSRWQIGLRYRAVEISIMWMISISRKYSFYLSGYRRWERALHLLHLPDYVALWGFDGQIE